MAVTTGIINDIRNGRIQVKKEPRKPQKNESAFSDTVSRSTYVTQVSSPKFRQKQSVHGLSMTESLSDVSAPMVHPINHLITKMSFLLRCVYKRRLERLGVSVDHIDFSKDTFDIQALQAVGSSAVDLV